MSDKADLRRRFRALRRALDPAAAEAAARAACAAVLDHGPRLAPDAIVAGTIAFGGEIDPAPLLTALAARGHPIALARTPPKGSSAGLSFHLRRPGDEAALERSAWGVLEPKAGSPRVVPSVVIAPLVAFDRRGGRLGMGAGHYDRTLAALRAAGPTLAIGLAFAVQEADALPIEDHDQRLDWIATEKGAYRVA